MKLIYTSSLAIIVLLFFLESCNNPNKPEVQKNERNVISTDTLTEIPIPSGWSLIKSELLRFDSNKLISATTFSRKTSEGDELFKLSLFKYTKNNHWELLWDSKKITGWRADPLYILKTNSEAVVAFDINQGGAHANSIFTVLKISDNNKIYHDSILENFGSINKTSDCIIIEDLLQKVEYCIIANQLKRTIKKLKQKLFFKSDLGGEILLEIVGDNINIHYQYSTYKDLTKAKLVNGKIFCTTNVPDWITPEEMYIIRKNEGDFCMYNPETGSYDCFDFIQNKSSTRVDYIFY